MATATKTAPATKETGKATNGTLPKGHLRVLQVLAKAKKPMTRKLVCAAVEALGVKCYGGRISNESATYAELTKGGYVKPQTLDIDGAKEEVYSVTPKGQKAIAK